jgi:hypothetical protein
VRVAAGEKIIPSRRWRLSAAAADHWFSVDNDVDNPRKVTVSDSVSNAGAGGALHRPAHNEIGNTTRSKDPDVQPVRARGIAGCHGDRFPRG